MAKSTVTRLRTPRRVEPPAAPQPPVAQSEDVLQQVELLYTAMNGLYFRAEAEVLSAEEDISPVLRLARDVRSAMIKLDKDLETYAAAQRQGVA